MGENSCSKGCEFKSRCCILDGHFFTLISCKNCIVCLKRPKNKRRRGRSWPTKSFQHLGFEFWISMLLLKFEFIDPLWSCENVDKYFLNFNGFLYNESNTNSFYGYSKEREDAASKILFETFFTTHLLVTKIEKSFLSFLFLAFNVRFGFVRSSCNMCSDQCDQMTRLCFQYLAIYSNEN